MAVIREGLEATQARRLRQPRSSPRSRRRRGRDGRARVAHLGGDVPRRRAGLERRLLRSATTTRTSSPRRSATAPSPRRRCCRAPACSCRRAAPPCKDKGLFRRNVPEFIADLCTGCMECALVCPDAAIPNTVHDIHDLLLTGDQAARRRRGRSARRCARSVYRARRARCARSTGSEQGRRGRSTRSWPRRRTALDADNADAARATSAGSPTRWRSSRWPGRGRSSTPWRRPTPGSGGLFAATIDPWKCTRLPRMHRGLRPRRAGRARAGRRRCWRRCRPASSSSASTPNTPARFVEGATGPDGDTKRLMLDRGNYYATTGGHGACRGCGEVTAIRLVIATNHAHPRRAPQASTSASSRALIDAAAAPSCASLARAATPSGASASRRRIATLEKRLYLCESGPTGNGPAERGDRQRHRLQQRLRLDLPVQPVQRPVGEQPVPGTPSRWPRASSRA